jgi:hypothetical protein
MTRRWVRVLALAGGWLVAGACVTPRSGDATRRDGDPSEEAEAGPPDVRPPGNGEPDGPLDPTGISRDAAPTDGPGASGGGGGTGGMGTGGGGTGGMGTGGAGTGGNGGCAPVGKSCSGDTLVTCAAGGKLTMTSCPTGCNPVTLACNACTPNQRTCSGSSAVTCRADGSGTDTTACTTGCNTGTGECNSCQPGTTWCNGGVLRECTAQGIQQNKQTCSYGCSQARLACNACMPGTQACSGASLETCNSDGSGVTAAVCPDGCNATLKICNACQPSALRCSPNGGSVQQCRADGSGWDEKTSCGTKGCSTARLACNACLPSSKSCSNATLTTCRADGSGADTTSCPNNCRPDGTDCLTCSSSEHACSGVCKSNNSPDSCGTSCSPCPAGRYAVGTCGSGTCGYACQAGSAQCRAGLNSCEKSAWSFESGSLDYWSSITSADMIDTGPLATSTGRAHAGSASAAMPISVTPIHHNVRLGLTPCGYNPDQHGIDWRNRTFRFWMYLDSPGAPAGTHDCYAGISSQGVQAGYDVVVKISSNQWQKASWSMPWPEAADTSFLTINCYLDSSKSWTGTLYFDDVAVE